MTYKTYPSDIYPHTHEPNPLVRRAVENAYDIGKEVGTREEVRILIKRLEAVVDPTIARVIADLRKEHNVV